MLTKAKKVEIVKSLREKFNKAEAVFVTSFRGFKVAESNEIRKILRENGAEFKVAKNTLIKIASQQTPVEPLNEYIEGPTGLVIVYKDSIEVAKILKKFIDTHPSLQIKGLVIKGKGYKGEVINDLVKLPSREILLAQVLGTLQAPLVNLVGVLSAVLRNFLYVLKAIEEKKKAKEENN